MATTTRMVNERQDELYKEMIGRVKAFAVQYPGDAYNEILGIVGLMCGYIIATAAEEDREAFKEVLFASVRQGLTTATENKTRN